jgi:hypothetical protein
VAARASLKKICLTSLSVAEFLCTIAGPGEKMKSFARLLPLLIAFPLAAQNPSSPVPDTWAPLAFLQGTWDATAASGGGVSAQGTYTFRPELGNHIVARHSAKTGDCKGPASFDCDHGDLLYIFQDAPGQPLHAIYFDNEGHVIHYDVSTPNPATAVFLSDASRPGPQFRLIYELRDHVMNGKFQMRMPGQADWKSYLEWSGPQHAGN